MKSLNSFKKWLKHFILRVHETGRCKTSSIGTPTLENVKEIVHKEIMSRLGPRCFVSSSTLNQESHGYRERGGIKANRAGSGGEGLGLIPAEG